MTHHSFLRTDPASDGGVYPSGDGVHLADENLLALKEEECQLEGEVELVRMHDVDGEARALAHGGQQLLRELAACRLAELQDLALKPRIVPGGGVGVDILDELVQAFT